MGKEWLGDIVLFNRGRKITERTEWPKLVPNDVKRQIRNLCKHYDHQELNYQLLSNLSTF